jgi:hypothetical protein
VSLRAILTEIRSSDAQEGPRGDVATVENELHRLVDEIIRNVHQAGLICVRLCGDENDTLRLV